LEAAAVLVVSLGVAACFRGEQPPDATPMLRIEGASLLFGGAALPLGAKLQAWSTVLGPPTRFVDRDGGIYVWDGLGMMAGLDLEFPASDPHVAALHVVFRHRDVDFWPRTPFRGRVDFVQEAVGAGARGVTGALDADTTMASIQRAGLSWRDSYPSLSRHTSLRFAPARHDGGTLEVCTVQATTRAQRP
jgi:hypothetical protein